MIETDFMNKEVFKEMFPDRSLQAKNLIEIKTTSIDYPEQENLHELNLPKKQRIIQVRGNPMK